MRGLVDTAMERFAKSQQTFKIFHQAKQELLADLQVIVEKTKALKSKVEDLSKCKEGDEQSVLFAAAKDFTSCLQIRSADFEKLLEAETL